jgi:hypothetical protein
MQDVCLPQERLGRSRALGVEFHGPHVDAPLALCGHVGVVSRHGGGGHVGTPTGQGLGECADSAALAGARVEDVGGGDCPGVQADVAQDQGLNYGCRAGEVSCFLDGGQSCHRVLFGWEWNQKAPAALRKRPELCAVNCYSAMAMLLRPRWSSQSKPG